MSDNKLKIKTNSLPQSRIAVELVIPAERCKSSYEEAISRLSRAVKLPGFRKGKVPRGVILQQVGIQRLQASALENLLEFAWKEALEKKTFEPLSEPELSEGFESVLENFDPNKSLTIILETDVSPKPSLKCAKGLTAESEEVAFDSKKVDQFIEQSQKQLATLIPVENRAAKKGDVGIVTFSGTFVDDGSNIEGGSAESMNIELEDGQMIPGFVEGIIGMKIDEKKVIKCEFPDDYPEEKAKGRKAEFNVLLTDLKTKELPDLDDAFAKQASDKNSMEELRKDLEKKIQNDTENQNKRNRQEALLEILVKQLDVEIPKTLIDREVMNLVEQTAQNFAQQGIDVKSMFTSELVKSLMESSREEAEENLRKKLALDALAKQENIKVDETELNKKITEVKKDLGNSKEKIDLKRLTEVVENDLLQEKLFDWLEGNNTIIKKIAENKKPPQQKKSKPKGSKKT